MELPPTETDKLWGKKHNQSFSLELAKSEMFIRHLRDLNVKYTVLSLKYLAG